MIWIWLATAGAADTWTVDGAASTVTAQLHLEDTAISRTTGFLDHVVKLGLVDGSVTVDGDAITAAKVTGVVASLKAGDAALRKAAGMAGNQTAPQAATLMDCVFNQLQPENVNEIAFTATGFEGTLPTVTVTGTFSLHGVDKPVSLPVTLEPEGEGMRATGTVDLNLPDYGFRIPADGWTVEDTATVVLDLKLKR